ncbi:MAG: DUF1002 domain-containing protein [Oscillospiraceae bacterium]
MKKFLVFLIVTAIYLALPIFAMDENSRAVIAADLTDEQIAEVYQSFGITRGSVPELTITNAVERSYLEGVVPDEQLGTKCISCVLISLGDDGITMDTENINWCTDAMYMSAVTTAGIENADIKVTAPVPVSGTAALAGIYLAYEDMTGQTLTDEAKQAGALELLTTAQLSDELGSDEALTLITELKLIIEETKNMSDEELAEKIDETADEYNISLNDYQREKLVDLCRGFEKLDPEALKDKVESMKETLQKMGELKDKTVSFFSALSEFFSAVGKFFSKIFAIFSN